MSFFSKLFHGESQESEPVLQTPDDPNCVASPVSGTVVSLKDINDEIFSKEVLGPGVGVKPDEEGKLYAPIGGTVQMVAETGHAFGISGNGIELLVHIGVDTVSLQGKGFFPKVKQGDTVACGQCMAEFDLTEIEKANLDPSVVVILTNSDEKHISAQTKESAVRAGAPLFWVEDAK